MFVDTSVPPYLTVINSTVCSHGVFKCFILISQMDLYVYLSLYVGFKRLEVYITFMQRLPSYLCQANTRFEWVRQMQRAYRGTVLQSI